MFDRTDEFIRHMQNYFIYFWIFFWFSKIKQYAFSLVKFANLAIFSSTDEHNEHCAY